MPQTEQEFLKNYDSSQFEKLSLTTDIVMLSVSNEDTDNYRKSEIKKMSVLLVKRESHPFYNKWCLPGGFVSIDESLESSPYRVLERETNLKNIYLEQLYTLGDVNRDPRMRIISTSYMALIDKNQLEYKVSLNASWFHIEYQEQDQFVTIFLDNGEERFSFIIKKERNPNILNNCNYQINQNESLAFDHPLIIYKAIERLKNKIEYTDIVFHMMPKYFTLSELQQVYEVILQKKLLAPAFRRIIASKVKKTTEEKRGAGHRPSIFYQYNSESR